ncbi:hypothetical protein EVAR_88768_1 [Eumeta japonica]|uniref:Uncharacterized protein n=1 Tax=Eumeta variegata TaxID=151549 RepID=A0A4C1XV27_EUMVA|nr:hypothetical protein EVAR_88768_1 [Eumeta japonica]
MLGSSAGGGAGGAGRQLIFPPIHLTPSGVRRVRRVNNNFFSVEVKRSQIRAGARARRHAASRLQQFLFSAERSILRFEPALARAVAPLQAPGGACRHYNHLSGREFDLQQSQEFDPICLQMSPAKDLLAVVTTSQDCGRLFNCNSPLALTWLKPRLTRDRELPRARRVNPVSKIDSVCGPKATPSVSKN